MTVEAKMCWPCGQGPDARLVFATHEACAHVLTIEQLDRYGVCDECFKTRHCAVCGPLPKRRAIKRGRPRRIRGPR